jgi:hypothetical protein
VVGTKQKDLYEQVIEVTNQYLGPAAERFVSRQIQMHLDKEPQSLTEDDLEKLVDWIRLAMALLSDDNKLVDDFSNSLLALAKKSPRYESR